MQNTENDLIMTHLYICSYCAHIDDLHTIFDSGTTYPHILAPSETLFFEQSISDLIGFQGNHALRNIGESGGVSVHIKSCLDSRFCLACPLPTKISRCVQ